MYALDPEVTRPSPTLPVWQRVGNALTRFQDAQRGSLFLWVPVCLAIGIWGYFRLPQEPAALVWSGLIVLVMLLAAALALGLRWTVLIGMFLVLLGVGLAATRTAWVAGPTLGWRYYGPVQGRIVGIDRSASDRVRLTLDRVVLEDIAPVRTPRRVRISLHGDGGVADPRVGQTAQITAHLGPPEGPVEPGGFDFQRHAFFLGIGAVGYSRNPLVLWSETVQGLWIDRMRMDIAKAVRRVLPGETGAFAAAVTTGDRSAMSQDTLAALRTSNLAHLLAISGLHMGLLTAVAFGALRFGMALIPQLCLRYPIKKYAAVGAFLAASGYLALSGGNVATQRAFIMVSVMLLAVIVDRRALTLRAVALAATIVLVLRPEALVGPGFQMSFAATTALVAIFRQIQRITPEAMPRWLRPVLATVVSSAVAGAATAPFAAAHFNHVAQYGLIANLLCVPLMGMMVMPAAVLAAVLAPIGLGWIGLALMAPAIDWILGVAQFVASMEDAVIRVPSPGAAVLPLIALGALWLIAIQGGARWLGLAFICAGFLIWSDNNRPDLLISSDGRLVGVMTEAGRALNKATGQGFAARVWLENDGDVPDQERAAQRPGFSGDDSIRRARVGDLDLAVVSGRGAAIRAADLCVTVDIVITAAKAEPGTMDCIMIDRDRLMRDGAVSARLTPQGLVWASARRHAGQRPWTVGAR